MKFILGHLMLIGVTWPGPAFGIRLQGSELRWWIGRDLTGSVLDTGAGGSLEIFADRQLRRAAETGEPLLWHGEERIAGAPRRYEAVILPLSDDQVRVNILLAAVRCADAPRQ